MGCGASSSKAKDQSFADVNHSSHDGSKDMRERRNRNFPDGDANRGALKKQIRRMMAAAVKKGSLEELEEALRLGERFGLAPDEEYYQAIQRVEYLRIKQGLVEAVRRRHAGTLEKAIKVARASPFQNQLASSISAADKLRAQLVELRIHRHDLPKMEPKIVSEIRSFKNPPSCVVTVMAAVHRLLGYRHKDVSTWRNIQTLMGKTGQESLLYRVLNFDPKDPRVETAEDVDILLKSVTYDEVLMASNGVAMFYVWANKQMEKINAELHKSKAHKKKKKRKS